MLYLAVDLGEKRTGLAAGDDVTELVSPLQVLDVPRGPRLFEAILKSIEEQRPDALVVGLPLNMDGTEGPQAKLSRDFAEELGERSGLPVHLQDERLTSDAAEKHLDMTGRTHKQKKKLRDALAAAEFLRDFLQIRHSREGGNPGDMGID